MQEGIMAALNPKFHAQSVNLHAQSTDVEALSMNFLSLSTNVDAFSLNIEAFCTNDEAQSTKCRAKREKVRVKSLNIRALRMKSNCRGRGQALPLQLCWTLRVDFTCRARSIRRGLRLDWKGLLSRHEHGGIARPVFC